jgi:O-antigen/teichoic acid export membrane protein
MLKQNLIANYLGQAWSSLIGLVLIPVYIKYLGIDAYGLIGIFALMQAWLMLLDMGLAPTLNREMARFKAGAHSPQSICNLLRTLEILSCLIAFVIGVLLYASSDWLSQNWLNSNNLSQEVIAQAICIMGLILALRFFEGIYRGTILGLQRQVLFNIVNAGLSTVRAIGAVLVLDLISPTIQYFFIWQLLMSLMSVIVFAIIAWRSLPKKNNPPRFSAESLNEIRYFAAGMILTTILGTLLTQVDKVLLSKLINLELFGYYTLASTVAASLGLIISPVTQAFYPRLNELVVVDNSKELIQMYHLSAQLVTVLMLPLTLTFIFYGVDLVYLWTGDRSLAAEVAPILSLLAAGAFFNGLMHVPYMLQLAFGWTSFAVRVNFIAVIVLIPSILWVTPRYGVVGTAWIWLALNLSYLLIAAHFMYSKLLPKEKWRWYREDILLPALGSATVTLVFYLIQPKNDSGLTELTLILIFNICIFITGLLMATQLRGIIITYFQRKYFSSFR